MPLTDTAIRNANPAEKPVRLFDGGGLYIEIAPSGGKWWRLKYRLDGKEKRISLGTYPDVGLKAARERRDEARKLLAEKVDPSLARKAEAATRVDRAANSFEVVAREWHLKFSPQNSESHSARNLRRLEVHVFPYVGDRPIAELEPPDILAALRRIEQKGNLETAHRVRVLVGQVMRYAIATGRATRDITADLRGAIPPSRAKHHAAVTDPKELGALLRAVYGYSGTPVVACALKLGPLVFQRPGELRHAEWTEFDLDNGLWTIPAGRMKRRKDAKENGPDHLVPLSRQAVNVLRDLHRLTGQGRYVFPGARSSKRPMSNMALGAAFRRMGIDSETAVPHGWRATARTLAVENLGIREEILEMQLSHNVRDSLGRAYNRTQWMDQRRELMQAWSDYLDKLRQTDPLAL
ncbi:tyrosine-type recombinase/integrase [Paraburkholderia phenoliruptrix]|uniref:tyrosine-type recombinase/integrase n=1 Tax=Paraburkholderia phenoliruptrix TaxID=252970 RepID=UPI001C4F85E9|nr:integrase arm-type DNA-binding domain-containing protein [Paraburkholderia phenoliruptrix]MBW0449272.1 integrase arm-type DNA-binding domain-containing protein [Paraburkholderia phenoliruptrix]MBW9097552.1 integrase arm-type DNA-binding domain-containing protein [Paraburkholderia phenoliruptrix]